MLENLNWKEAPTAVAATRDGEEVVAISKKGNLNVIDTGSFGTKKIIPLGDGVWDNGSFSFLTQHL